MNKPVKYSLAVVICIMAIILTACQKHNSIISDGIIVFPGTTWNMTPNEVITALSINESTLEVHVDTPADIDHPTSEYCISTENITVLGHSATVYFTFLSHYDNSELGLASVMVQYRDDVDMEVIKSYITEQCGEADGITMTQIYYWNSDTLLAKYIDHDQIVDIESRYADSDLGAYSLEQLQSQPASCLYWANEVKNGVPNIPPGIKVLVFCSDLASVLQYDSNH